MAEETPASAIEVELGRNELAGAGSHTHLVCAPPAWLVRAERQRRVGAVHVARLERKRTATLVSSTSRQMRLLRWLARNTARCARPLTQRPLQPPAHCST